jgi:hypothetical protein
MLNAAWKILQTAGSNFGAGPCVDEVAGSVPTTNDTCSGDTRSPSPMRARIRNGVSSYIPHMTELIGLKILARTLLKIFEMKLPIQRRLPKCNADAASIMLSRQSWAELSKRRASAPNGTEPLGKSPNAMSNKSSMASVWGTASRVKALYIDRWAWPPKLRTKPKMPGDLSITVGCTLTTCLATDTRRRLSSPTTPTSRASSRCLCRKAKKRRSSPPNFSHLALTPGLQTRTPKFDPRIQVLSLFGKTLHPPRLTVAHVQVSLFRQLRYTYCRRRGLEGYCRNQKWGISVINKNKPRVPVQNRKGPSDDLGRHVEAQATQEQQVPRWRSKQSRCGHPRRSGRGTTTWQAFDMLQVPGGERVEG